MPTPEIHATLSASASNSWLNCAQYIKVQKMFSESTSPYAEAGRLAHAIAEYKARTYFHEPVGKRAYNSRLKKFAAEPNYDPAMEVSQLFTPPAWGWTMTSRASVIVSPYTGLNVARAPRVYSPI